MFPLMPSKTLPGWPSVHPESTVFLLTLCVFGPLLIGVVISVIAYGRSLIRRNRQASVAAGLADASPPALSSSAEQAAAPASLTSGH